MWVAALIAKDTKVAKQKALEHLRDGIISHPGGPRTVEGNSGNGLVSLFLCDLGLFYAPRRISG
jgi:hypothetical protein